MARAQSHRQLSPEEFDRPFQTVLDADNRWIKMSERIPWDSLAEAYYEGLSSTQGGPTKDVRLVIGALIIKHKLNLSDRETVAQIQENPYLQYFVGLPDYQMDAPFVPSLFVEIRKRMGQSVFVVFYDAVIDAVGKAKQNKPATKQKAKAKPSDDDESPTSISDDELNLSLLNEGRKFSEQIIDRLYAKTDLKQKPRTYRRKARKAYLAIAKKKRPGAKLIRRGIKQQLQYLRRNLGHIERLLEHFPECTPLPLPRWLLRRYWVIQHVFAQQWEMYYSKAKRCDDRIVSISQPYVRPIVRDKVDKLTEFGAKLSVSLTGNGVARIDHLRWDAFHQGCDLPSQVEAYLKHHGVYPEVVLGDTIYCSRDNPSSESLFRTLKYLPKYPEHAFADLLAARRWVQGFVDWYNGEHLHSAIGFVTPAQRHTGEDVPILARRKEVYLAARSENPERWSGDIRNWNHVKEVQLNPDTQKTEGEENKAA